MSSFRGPLTPPIEPDPEPRHPAALDSFRRFIQLTAHKRDLNKELRGIKRDLEMLEPMLRDYLDSEGIKRITIEDFTVYLRPELWGRPREGVNGDAVCQALKACGLGHFVHERYYAKQLAGHIEGLTVAYQKELEDGVFESVAELLPEALAAVLDVNPYFKVVALDKRGKAINDNEE